MIGQNGKQNVNETTDPSMDHNPLRVLMVIPYLPSQQNVITVIAKRVLEALKKKCNSKIIWILQTPKQSFETDVPDIVIKPIQNFNDACDLIDKETPDVIFTELSFDYSSYPFIIAGKQKKIPVVCYSVYGYDYRLEYPLSRFEIMYSKISRFFSRNTDSKFENQLFGKGIFYLYKYRFFLKTVRAMKTNIGHLFLIILESIWIHSFGIMNKKFDKRLMGDAICLANDTWIDPLLKEGYAKDILRVTGSPLFDEYVIDSLPSRSRPQFPVKVLLVTTPMSTHGVWSSSRQRSMVKNIVSELNKHQEKINFAIKIHPTSESHEFYQDILNEMNLDNKIYQKEKLSEILKQFDVVISFGIFSGSTMELLYSRLPFVMINMFTDIKSYSFIQNSLVTECTSMSNLMDSITKAMNSDQSQEKLKKYLHTLSKPMDGKSSERVADVIISVVNRCKSQIN
jgi:hypothetical protein